MDALTIMLKQIDAPLKARKYQSSVLATHNQDWVHPMLHNEITLSALSDSQLHPVHSAGNKGWHPPYSFHLSVFHPPLTYLGELASPHDAFCWMSACLCSENCVLCVHESSCVCKRKQAVPVMREHVPRKPMMTHDTQQEETEGTSERNLTQ
jgi:hypothetical protein